MLDGILGSKMARIGFKKQLKKSLIFGALLEGLWSAKASPGDPKSDDPGSTGRGRGGVNPPQGRGGLKDFWKGVLLNHLSPRGLVEFMWRPAICPYTLLINF